MVTQREDLSIATLVYYIILLPIAIYVIFRNGLSKKIGWIFVMLLALVRIIGSAMQIASTNNDNESLTEGSLVLSNVGLSPLLLATLWLLSRVNDSMPKQQRLNKLILHLTQCAISGALVLAIIGGTKQFDDNPSTAADGRKYTKIAIVIFLAVVIFLTLLTLVMVAKLRYIPAGERSLILAIILSIPFLFVRLIYSMVGAFESNPKSSFSSIYGSVVLQGFMSVMEEFIVVGIYLAAGLTVQKFVQDDEQQGKYSTTIQSEDTQYEFRERQGMMSSH
ncbi:MAG: hypothetical protein M1834_001355 [Cirrosporium novae-zelandiae]|nr:MAG: hypothetical protein M1834_001355 [Cirrosporium novae-zelandiae]